MNSLRAVLGLPLHDLFHDSTFCEHAQNETTSPDVENTDHGTVQPLPQSNAPTSSPLPSMHAFPANDGNADSNADSQLQAV